MQKFISTAAVSTGQKVQYFIIHVGPVKEELLVSVIVSKGLLRVIKLGEEEKGKEMC